MGVNVADIFLTMLPSYNQAGNTFPNDTVMTGPTFSDTAMAHMGSI